MKKFFNAVVRGNKIGDGTALDMIQWLEQFINLLFPENGIEYWTKKGQCQSTMRPQDPIPHAGGHDGAHHAACYVRSGSNEGEIIEVHLYMNNGTFKSICWAKSFGRSEENWLIARAICAVLESVIFYHQVPTLVDLGSRLPRHQQWHRETSLKTKIVVATSQTTLSVSTVDGTVLGDWDWSDLGENAKYTVAAYLQDWETILQNMKAVFTIEKERRLFAADLTGYTISDRGIDGVQGYYVLPPNGNPKDDRDYIGYFQSADAAMRGARAHRDSERVVLA